MIFGLRGTLLERLHLSKVPLTHPPSTIAVGMHKVWIRPGVNEAIDELHQHWDLAVWSSTTARNTMPLMDAVFGERRGKFSFVWTREQTMPDEYRRTGAHDGEDENATIKDLSLVWRAFPQYTPQRTVLIDDTTSKAKRNADNFLWMRSYCDNLDDKKGLAELLKVVSEKLLPSSDVRLVLPLII